MGWGCSCTLEVRASRRLKDLRIKCPPSRLPVPLLMWLAILRWHLDALSALKGGRAAPGLSSGLVNVGMHWGASKSTTW